MALELMKLKITLQSQIETNPNCMRFFYVTTDETEGGETLLIDAADFLDDTGTIVTELPALETNNSYFNVYINGVLQMEDISTYTPGITEVGELKIEVPSGTKSILEDSPIVLELVNYIPSSDNIIQT